MGSVFFCCDTLYTVQRDHVSDRRSHHALIIAVCRCCCNYFQCLFCCLMLLLSLSFYGQTCSPCLDFHNTFVTPIEKMDVGECINTKYRRLNRCFIVSNEKVAKPDEFIKARQTLYEYASNALQDDVERNSDQSNINIVLRHMPPLCIPSFMQMVKRSITIKELKALATVYKILSSDRSLDLFVPLSCIDIALGIVDPSISPVQFKEKCVDLHKSCPELASLTWLSAQASPLGTPSCEVTQLVKELCTMVKKVHLHDVEAETAIPRVGTYNPGKYGRAYYFEDHGCQIRSMRRFTIDEKAKQKDVTCNKHYPTVSKKGTSYLFLWVCAHHMHCMGFHVIPSSEGCKDASASLYTHCKKPPACIFYDNACTLAEYVKSRESGYFKNTKFYHDKFHGFSHKCPESLNSARINTVETQGTNSSVCEEINSFLQRVKAAGRLMSQAHFIFYLQFFIHQWNAANRLTQQKKLNIAIEGMI